MPNIKLKGMFGRGFAKGREDKFFNSYWESYKMSLDIIEVWFVMYNIIFLTFLKSQINITNLSKALPSYPKHTLGVLVYYTITSKLLNAVGLKTNIL